MAFERFKQKFLNENVDRAIDLFWRWIEDYQYTVQEQLRLGRSDFIREFDHQFKKIFKDYPKNLSFGVHIGEQYVIDIDCRWSSYLYTIGTSLIERMPKHLKKWKVILNL